MPANLYGDGDNFAIPGAHVVPMLIRRMHEAKERGDTSFVIYGSGRPRRELLHADDLATACLFLLERYDDPLPINVGTGSEVTIDELAAIVADAVGFDGEFVHDTTVPDGAMSKLLDTSRIRDLGWRPEVSLPQGIRRTYEWFLAHQSDARL
jgi:GDP-L-fucose synthase